MSGNESPVQIEWLLEALRESDPHSPMIEEQEKDCYIIDGHFDLRITTRRLSEKLRRQPS